MPKTYADKGDSYQSGVSNLGNGSINDTKADGTDEEVKVVKETEKAPAKLAEQARQTNGKGQSIRENIADYLPDSRLKDSILRKAEANREKRKDIDEYKRNKREAIEKYGRKDWKKLDQLHKHDEENKQKEKEVTLAKSKEAERGLTERDLERKWQSDLPTNELGSSYFQQTRPGLKTLSKNKTLTNVPLNISSGTPFSQAKRDSKFRDIARGINLSFFSPFNKK